MRIDENENVIIFNKEELDAIDKVIDIIFELGYDYFRDGFTIAEIGGELWEMRRKSLDRIAYDYS